MESSNVQPADTGGNGAAEGQGEGTGLDAGLYPGIEQVPAEYRQHVDPILKEVESNLGKKLQEHAEFRKQWEPYSETGINELDPETVQDLVTLVDIMNDEEQFPEWWRTVGQEMGFLDSLREELAPEDDFDDDLDIDDEGLSEEELAARFEEMLEQKLGERLEPILSKEQEREQEQMLQQADEQIQEQIDALKEEHGEFDEDAVYKLALAYDGPDALKQGFEEYQRIVSGAENGLLKDKTGQPPKPEGEGPADTSPKKITDFKDATAAAAERIREMQSS